MTVRKILPALLVAWLLVAALPVEGDSSPGSAEDVSMTDDLDTHSPAVQDEGRFIENLGQWPSHVGFVAQTSFGEAVLGNDGVTYDVRTADGGHRIMVSFENHGAIDPIGRDVEGPRTNYFRGSGPEGWVTGARSYKEVLYEDVWPGVDVRYYFRGSDLKYDISTPSRTRPPFGSA